MPVERGDLGLGIPCDHAPQLELAIGRAGHGDLPANDGTKAPGVAKDAQRPDRRRTGIGGAADVEREGRRRRGAAEGVVEVQGFLEARSLAARGELDREPGPAALLVDGYGYPASLARDDQVGRAAWIELSLERGLQAIEVASHRPRDEAKLRYHPPSAVSEQHAGLGEIHLLEPVEGVGCRPG